MTTMLSRIMDRVAVMPPISPNTLAIIEMISDENYETKDLVKLVETDLTLSVRCLQTVNSPAYGLRNNITTIARAVTFLGANTIATLALKTGMSKLLRINLRGYEAGQSDLWEHSLRTAIAARATAKILKLGVHPETAYAAGLVHDIGKVILSEFLVDRPVTLDSVVVKKEGFLSAENQLLQTDHTKIGERISKKWRLPKAFEAAIRFHHHPSDADRAYRNLCVAVHLGDIVAMLGGSGTGTDNLAYPIDHEAIDSFIKRDFNWEMYTFPKLLLDVEQEYEKMTNLDTESGGANAE